MTIKSFLSTGSSIEFRTSIKSEILPLNLRSSVKTLITSAPPSWYLPAKDLASSISAKAPLLGDDLFISAINRIPGLLRDLYAPLKSGALFNCSFNVEIGIRRFSKSSNTPSTIDVNTFDSLICRIHPFR